MYITQQLDSSADLAAANGATRVFGTTPAEHVLRERARARARATGRSLPSSGGMK